MSALNPLGDKQAHPVRPGRQLSYFESKSSRDTTIYVVPREQTLLHKQYDSLLTCTV